MAEVVKGLARTLKALDDLGKNLEPKIDTITFDNAQQIEGRAKSLAPKDMNTMAKTINTRKTAELTYTVASPAPYSAYVEFGTGGQVYVPAEMQEEAAKFIGKKGGSFEKGLDNIKQWCRRNGIDESAAYPIFLNILKNGLRPRPFMYPAFVAQRREYLAELEDLLDRETKKI